MRSATCEEKQELGKNYRQAPLRLTARERSLVSDSTFARSLKEDGDEIIRERTSFPEYASHSSLIIHVILAPKLLKVTQTAQARVAHFVDPASIPSNKATESRDRGLDEWCQDITPGEIFIVVTLVRRALIGLSATVHESNRVFH